MCHFFKIQLVVYIEDTKKFADKLEINFVDKKYYYFTIF